MKRLGVLAAATLISVGAMAADSTINGTARLSWRHTDNDTKKSGILNDSRITAEFAKMYFAGTLNSSTKYYMTWNLAGAAITGATQKDATNAFVEKAGIVKTLADGLDLNIGKQMLLAGGTELSYSTADQYLQSAFSTTGNGLAKQFGATLSKAFAGQTFSIQLANGNMADRGTATTSAQTRYGYAAHWAGDFSNGMVKPMVGYTMRPGGDTTTDTTMLGAGVQFNLSQFRFEADYGLITEAKGQGTTADGKTTSIVGVGAYTGHENYTPFAKFVKDTYKTANDGSKVADVTAFGLGVEYKESKADAVRYHAVYTSSETKYASSAIATAAGLVAGNQKYTVGTIMVGAKIDLSILK